ncbi:MAG: hypothetical protein KBG20_03845 [Caldilineaceae bacterium]|nr:hypothetical protein [Caldilineaceae bacterium]MBP8106542.1 hypothetical protein [Caldilineaceae bacterium]MBP8121564.1 hypothetical protein [Caldilineaceae bacterium]MBP9071401.1 hypothetical protein [Caldilineaceae bacterium]
MSNTPNQYWTSLGHADFWYTAQMNCALIDHFQPELIIGLAHGGILPTKVTETAWSSLTDRPFPPILYTNLGREKIDYYKDWCKVNGGHPGFIGEQSGLEGILHFLDWLPSRVDWQDELLHQIEATLGADVEPGVIMVIDEMAALGNTMLLTLGLLEILYPMAETHFVDHVYFQWRSDLGQLWMKEHHPQVLEHILAEAEQGAWADLHAIYRIMSGTEDIDPVSLSFRPLSPENEDVQRLVKYLPAETLLSMPAQTEATVLDEITQLAAARTMQDARGRVSWEYVGRANRLAPYRLLRHLRKWGQITLSEAARTLGVKEDEVKEVMEHLVPRVRHEARYGRMRDVDASPTRSGLTYHFVEEPEWGEPPVRRSKGEQIKAMRRDPRPRPRVQKQTKK